MARKTIEQLYAEHVGKISDKWSFYLTEYERIFEEYQDRAVRLLEIGIQNGGSLEIWSKYFPNAKKLVGCDINPDCARLSYDDSRIAVVVGDANINTVQEVVLGYAATFDIIIDDGSHRSSDVVKSFARYFPYLADHGVFIVEDIHTSYWQEFEGGLFDPFSSMTFFKRLADVVNYEHWGIEKARAGILRGFFSKYDFQMAEDILRHVHSVEFINSICVIRKDKPVQNRLGTRVIVGSEGVVIPKEVLRSSQAETIDQTGNEWTARSMPPDEELLLRINELFERDGQISSLNQAVVERDGQISSLNQAVVERDGLDIALREIYGSTSWRLSKPIRVFGRWYRRGKKALSILRSTIAGNGGAWRLFRKASFVARSEGLQGFIARVKFYYRLSNNLRDGVKEGSNNISIHQARSQNSIAYAGYIESMEPKQVDLALMKEIQAEFNYRPKFSIVVPVYNVEERWLRRFIESVQSQVYPDWELCISDDCSTDPKIRPLLIHYAAADPRIKLVFRETNGHISAATNSAIDLATGDFMCLMDNDDEIAPNALYEFAHLLSHDAQIDMIYSDEDKIDLHGNRYEPFFKPDWSPESLEGCMYTAHFACYRMSIVRLLGGFRTGYEGAQDYDFVLRYTEHAKKIIHIPKVLYHWRAVPGSTAATMDAKDYVLDAALRALQDRARRVSGGGVAKLGRYSGSFDVRYAIQGLPLVSVIISSAGRVSTVRGKQKDLLVHVVRSIHEKNTYRNFEFIIVDNDDLRQETIEALSPYNCKFVHFKGQFNIAIKMNMGAKEARGEYLLFMNDDIEAIANDWMECMLQLAQRPGIGVVGAKLYFESDKLQHVGVAFWNGLPDHICREIHGSDPGHFFSSCANRNYLAVTGAVLMTKRSVFEEIGGFDERLAINYNDIDYCLKVIQSGRRVVFAAGAELYHYESVSRARTVAADEIKLFQNRWRDLVSSDPYYSPFFENHPPNFILRNDWSSVTIVDPMKSIALFNINNGVKM
ncbi:MAG: glycosyltransferase [Anaerolineales bacterium]